MHIPNKSLPMTPTVTCTKADSIQSCLYVCCETAFSKRKKTSLLYFLNRKPPPSSTTLTFIRATCWINTYRINTTQDVDLGTGTRACSKLLSNFIIIQTSLILQYPKELLLLPSVDLGDLGQQITISWSQLQRKSVLLTYVVLLTEEPRSTRITDNST